MIPDGVEFCHYIPVARHEVFASVSAFHSRSSKCTALNVGSTNYCCIIIIIIIIIVVVVVIIIIIIIIVVVVVVVVTYQFVGKSNKQIIGSFAMPL